MKNREEIFLLQNLADLAATLLETGSAEAREAAKPIIGLIKAQFVGSNEAAPQADNTCNQSEGADPVAAATERLRLAMLAHDQAKAERDAHCEATEELEIKAREARKAKDKAQGDLVLAIEAANRA